jgi:hypothetical protein
MNLPQWLIYGTFFNALRPDSVVWTTRPVFRMGSQAGSRFLPVGCSYARSRRPTGTRLGVGYSTARSHHSGDIERSRLRSRDGFR